MKITKRYWHRSPAATINIWFIPTLAYTMQKVGGVQFNEYEWVWWVGIPMLVACCLNSRVVGDDV